MEKVLKYTAIFFIVVAAGISTAWVFKTFVLDPSSDHIGEPAPPTSGVAITTQLNQQIGENVYPRLNEIIKKNRDNPAKMGEEIAVAYRGLPPTLQKPLHGVMVSNNTSGSVGGLLIVDTTNTPDFDTLVTLTEFQNKDNFGNPWKLSVMVSGGRVLELPVPKGEYGIEFASGVAWFGPENLFGPITDRLGFNGAYKFDEKNIGYQFETYPKPDADFQISAIKQKPIPLRDRGAKDKIERMNRNAAAGTQN